LIGVLGATGHTGRRIVGSLAGLGQPVLVTGRRAGAAAELAERHGLRHAVCDVRRPDQLASVMERCEVVINASGPYVALGWPACEAAVAAGRVLFDLAGEPAFVRRCQQQLHAPARRTGAVIGNAMGVEVVISDCAAARLARRVPQPRTVRVVNRVRDFAPSPGSARSFLHVMADSTPRLRWGEVGEPHGRRCLISASAVDALIIPRHLGSATEVWLDVPAPLAVPARVCGRRGRRMASRLGGRLVPLIAKPGRHRTPFRVRVELEGTRRAVAQVDGERVYDATARITAWCAARALERRPPPGVQPPSAIIDPDAFFRAMPELVWTTVC